MSRRVAAAAACLLAIGLAACSSPAAPTGAPPQPSPTSSPTEPSSSPSPTPTPRTANPLSGARVNVDAPVLVVKIDNTRAAQPQRGLAQADVVYVEPVEFGLTRLAAVYSTRLPAEVGPVRSARESDLELFRQYGKVAFAYSGARKLVVRKIAKAPLYPLDELSAPSGFRRSGARAMPFNLFARPAQLLRLAPQAAPAPDVGFRFGAPVAGGRAAVAVTARWPNARTRFSWSAQEKRWLWSMDGRAVRDDTGRRIGATTVIVQYVDTPLSSYRDFLGARTPLPRTVGTGAAVVLRDGLAYDAAWSRPTADGPTRWTVGTAELPLAPGQVWVVLMDRRTPATVE
jgi:hypothetical protein